MPSVPLLSLFSYPSLRACVSLFLSHRRSESLQWVGMRVCRRGRQCKRAVMYEPVAGQVSFQEINEDEQ